jgi:hypothetical protein
MEKKELKIIMNTKFTEEILSISENKKGFDFKNFEIKIINKYNMHKKNYCFIYFPYWQKEDRIVKHLRLKKYLKKKEFKDFNFNYWKKSIVKNQIYWKLCHYGIQV